VQYNATTFTVKRALDYFAGHAAENPGAERRMVILAMSFTGWKPVPLWHGEIRHHISSANARR
jgi:hypothetical protein